MLSDLKSDKAVASMEAAILLLFRMRLTYFELINKGIFGGLLDGLIQLPGYFKSAIVAPEELTLLVNDRVSEQTV